MYGELADFHSAPFPSSAPMPLAPAPRASLSCGKSTSASTRRTSAALVGEVAGQRYGDRGRTRAPLSAGDEDDEGAHGSASATTELPRRSARTRQAPGPPRRGPAAAGRRGGSGGARQAGHFRDGDDHRGLEGGRCVVCVEDLARETGHHDRAECADHGARGEAHQHEQPGARGRPRSWNPSRTR